MGNMRITYRILNRKADCNISLKEEQNNTEALLDASKEVGLEVNSEKTKYMLMSCKKQDKSTV
jgi:hypothetical protein